MRRTIEFHGELSRLLTARLKEPSSRVDRELILRIRDQIEERLDYLCSLQENRECEPIIYL